MLNVSLDKYIRTLCQIIYEILHTQNLFDKADSTMDL